MKTRIITIFILILFLFGVGSVVNMEADAKGSPVIVLSEKNYKSEVLDEKGIVLVEFWAPWCGPCRKMAPMLKKYAEDNIGKVKVGKMNAEMYKRFVLKQGVEMLPTLIVYKDGVETGRAVGALNRDELDEFVYSKTITDPAVQ